MGWANADAVGSGLPNPSNSDITDTTLERQHPPPSTRLPVSSSSSISLPPLPSLLSQVAASSTSTSGRATPASQLQTSHIDPGLSHRALPWNNTPICADGSSNGSTHQFTTPEPGAQNFQVYNPYPMDVSRHPQSSASEHKSASPSEGHDELPSSAPPKKRRRPALSCEPCRRRKVKCDRLNPCGPCVRTGHASGCEYDGRFPRAGVHGLPEPYLRLETPPRRPLIASQHRHPASSIGAVRDVTNSNASVRNSVDNAAYSIQAPNASERLSLQGLGVCESDDGAGQAVRALHDRLIRVESMTKEAWGNAQPTTNDTLQQSIQILIDKVHDLERVVSISKQLPSVNSDKTGLSVQLAAPRTRVNGTKFKFFGPTHYIHLFDTKSEFLGQVMAASSKEKFDVSKSPRATSTATLLGTLKSLRKAIKHEKQQQVHGSETLAQIVRTLPPWDVRDQLVGHYLRTFELIYRIFHIPSLRRLYDEHFRHLDNAPVLVQVQLLLIFSIGAVFADDSHRANLLPLIPRWLAAVQIHLNGVIEKDVADENYLQAYCLLVLARQANSVGTKEQTYALASTMVRLAFTLGLHRDPSYLSAVPPFRAEMRRRLWTTTVELALLASWNAAMPPLVVPNDYDCEAPMNIDDQHLIESASDLPSPSPRDVYTAASIQILLSESLSARLEICRMLNDFAKEVPYDKALDLSGILQEACKYAVKFFGEHLNRFADWSRPKDLHKQIVDTVLWSSQLYLHRAFYATARKDQRFHYSRHMCLEAAKAVIAPLSDLDPQSSTFNDYSKLVLAGCGTFKSPLSLNVIGIIVLEVTAKLGEAVGVSNHAAFATLDPLIHLLEHVRAQCLQIIKSGDPSCKRYVYLSISLAMIKALEAGKSANSAVADAIGKSFQACIDIMTSQVDGALPTAANEVHGAAIPSNDNQRELDLSALEDVDFNFDPGWLLSIWNFTEGRN